MDTEDKDGAEKEETFGRLFRRGRETRAEHRDPRRTSRLAPNMISDGR